MIMKLRNVDFSKLPYPVKLKFDEDGVKSELILVGILVPGNGVYAGIPIIYLEVGEEMQVMTLPIFINRYGDMDVGLLLGGT